MEWLRRDSRAYFDRAIQPLYDDAWSLSRGGLPSRHESNTDTSALCLEPQAHSVITSSISTSDHSQAHPAISSSISGNALRCWPHLTTSVNTTISIAHFLAQLSLSSRCPAGSYSLVLLSTTLMVSTPNQSPRRKSIRRDTWHNIPHRKFSRIAVIILRCAISNVGSITTNELTQLSALSSSVFPGGVVWVRSWLVNSWTCAALYIRMPAT